MILEAALIGGLFLALRRKPEPVEEAPKDEAPAPPPEPGPETQPATGGDILQQIGEIAPLVGLAAAGAAASSELAGAINNTTLSRVAGTIGPVGVTAVVGATVGEAIDRQLTGGMDATTSAIGQGVGAGVALSLATMGPVFLMSAGVSGAIIYAVGSMISDAVRLAGGQKMAQEEYDKKWQETYDRLRSKAIELGMSEAMAHRVAVPYADGFARELNRQAYRKWMRAPKGWGNTDAYHEEWGRDRGYFAGNGWPGADKDFLHTEPALKCHAHAYFSAVPREDMEATVTTQRVSFWVHPVTKQRFPMVPPGYVWNAFTPKFMRPRNWLDPAGTEPKTVTTYKDTKRDSYVHAGSVLAIHQSITEWMTRAWGLGFNAKRHLDVGIKEGAVWSGVQPQDDGSAIVHGKRFDWRKPEEA